MVFIIGVILSSCHDDLLYDNSIIGDGESDVSVELSFTPMGSALNTRSDGQAIKDIKNLCVVIYKSNGEFYDKFMANELTGYKCDPDGNTQYPADSLKYQEYQEGVQGSNFDYIKDPKTPKATFDVKLPYGKYRIYAVANLGMLSDEITENEETLKAHRVSWNPKVSSETGANGEGPNGDRAMFGYFTDADDTRSMGFDAHDLVIDKPNISLHCWIKRVVSKVTIAFDPSGLKESVSVYIRSVTIHDIPATCSLGKNNEPGSENELLNNPQDVETIYYKEGATNSAYTSWLRLQKGTKISGSPEHKETDDALYFFENMQGDYQGEKKFCKEQDPTEDKFGTSINEPEKDDDGNVIVDENNVMKTDFKDRVPYGTYIEVEGYYVSQNKEKISKGPIKYRFMLGKNTTYNYNAERNFHYKLTLKFRGWANQADWHIVYDEISPTIFIPDPYYISYLYNESMTLPIRITGYDQIKANNYHLHAQIVENNWAPSTKSGVLAPQSSGAYNDPNGFAWNQFAYDHTYKDENYVGFLSLRALAENEREIVGSEFNYGEAANEYLKSFYLGNEGQHVPVYYADYALDDIKSGLPINGADRFGTYDIVEGDDDKSKSVTLNIPMFTRQKELVPATDFSGNNAFFAFYRKATVRFSLRDKDAPDPSDDKYSDVYDKPFKIKKEIRNPDGSLQYNPDGSIKYDEYEAKYVDINILQVPRIVNPKAIWRSYNSREKFHIELMELDGAGESSFNTFKSDGPWRASILSDPKGLIKLYSGSQEVPGKGKYIEGSSDTEIDFWYEPNGTVGEYETRCGIILVEYHDYTCKHLIFVRQGYDCGVTLGGANWSCYNAYAAQGNREDDQPEELTETNVIVTNSPLSVGSLFKRCNYNYAILESNETEYGWLDKVAGNLSTVHLRGSTIEERNATWAGIVGYAWTRFINNDDRSYVSWAETWNAVNKNNKELAVPTYDQYLSLRDNCSFGYGVVYADGAQSVAKNADDAYGYTNYSNASGENAKSSKGIRACIAYSRDTGDNIIFPLGATGQARRARGNFAPTYNSTYNSLNLTVFPNPGPGAISYGGVSGLLYADARRDGKNNNDRPLTFNLYREAGGIYWFRKPNKNTVYPNKGNGKVASWDINYYTLLFNAYESGSLGSRDTVYVPEFKITPITNETSSAALPIKFIYK
ncbi:MAG: hypothetical protein K2N35_05440 [Muribaculaceae bacterium]|nr:hypothetical protein [Muribaculaceae bacterium]